MFIDLDLENSLGGDREREGRVEKEGISCWGDYRGVCWGYFCRDFLDGGDWGTSHGDCARGCYGVVSDDGLWKEKYWRTAWGDGDLHKSKEAKRYWGNQSQKTLNCVQSFLALISPVPLCLFRFVEISISSGCSPVFFFLVFFWIFWQVLKVVMESEVPMLLVQLVLVLVLLLLFLMLLVLLFLPLLVLLSGSFSLFWSPGSTLPPVFLGSSQVPGAGLVVGQEAFLDFYSCCCWLSSMGRIVIRDLIAYRTSTVPSCPLWPPSSAGLSRSVYEEWPESHPYRGQSHCVPSRLPSVLLSPLQRCHIHSYRQ